MTTFADTGYPTLVDVCRRLAPDGSVEQQIAEVLNKQLDILDDIPWVQGNLPTGHRITSRTGLPSPSWRKLNAGVDITKSNTAQYDETCGMLEDYSNVDVALANLNGDAAAYRATEDKAKLEGFAQTFANALFYENATTTPEAIHGLSPRYAASTGYTASSYVLPKGSLSGVNCESVWLITWGPERVFGIFPKNSRAGLYQEDLGKQLVLDSSSKQYTAYVTHFKWDCGIAVKNYKYCVRMQWDPDDSSAFPDSGKNMYLYMEQMLGTVEKVEASTRFYMSRTSFNKLSAQLASNSANYLEYVAAGGRRIPSFLGCPIRVTDALIGESAIS